MNRCFGRALAVAVSFGCLALLPGARAAARGDDPELVALLDLLDRETSIATQTRMNADYVPGMVTVMLGEDLRAQGLATVGDALAGVAGFHLSVNNVGDVQTIVRGVGATVNASSLKILLDGVAVNRPVDGSADWVLRLPLRQVARIEVIRGPGSALYGEFAFAGVVNVLTREGRGAGLRIGSDHAREADVRSALRFDNGASLQLDVSAWGRSDSGLQTLADNFTRGGLGHAPSAVFDGARGRLMLADLGFDGYRLQLQHAVLERGGGHGRTAAIPAGLDPRVEKVNGIHLGKTWTVDGTLSLSALIGRLDTDLESAAFLPIPAGVDPPGPAPASPVDIFRRDGNADTTERAEFGLHWAPGTAHRLFVGLSRVRNRADSAFMVRFPRGGPVVAGASTETSVVAGSQRVLTSVTLQDQVRLGEALDLTVGARYDHYDDWGAHTSPRIAAVWRASAHHIFKVQYAEAFRPPTLEELYSGPDTFPGSVRRKALEEEGIRSMEAVYVFRRAEHRLRLTAFRTEVSDLIEFFLKPGDPPFWRNRGDIDTQGAELEWEQRIGRSWQWTANAAYVDAADHLDADGELLGAADWLANLSVTWRRDGGVSHTLRARYVGTVEGWDLRTRDPQRRRFDAYAVIDYGLLLADAFAIDGLQLSAGIDNLTGRRYQSVATPAQFPQGLTRGERGVWVQLEYDF